MHEYERTQHKIDKWKGMDETIKSGRCWENHEHNSESDKYGEQGELSVTGEKLGNYCHLIDVVKIISYAVPEVLHELTSCY